MNANGRVYASPEYSTDLLPILDPTHNSQTSFRAPVRDERMPLSLGPGHAASLTAMAPSAYWGEEAIWDTRVNNHNSMLDAKGRVWLAASVRGRENPAFCKKGSEHPSAKVFPLDRSPRQAAMLNKEMVNVAFETTLEQGLLYCNQGVHARRDVADRNPNATPLAWSATDRDQTTFGLDQ